MNLIEKKTGTWHYFKMSTKISATLKKQFLFKTQQLADLEQKLMEAGGTLNAGFSWIQKKSKKKNRKSWIVKIFKATYTPWINLVFIFILLLNFPKEKRKKYPQIYLMRNGGNVFSCQLLYNGVKKESEARLNFLLFFFFFLYFLFFWKAALVLDYRCVHGKILFICLLWLLRSKKRTTSQARGWKSTPIIVYIRRIQNYVIFNPHIFFL